MPKSSCSRGSHCSQGERRGCDQQPQKRVESSSWAVVGSAESVWAPESLRRSEEEAVEAEGGAEVTKLHLRGAPS